MGNFWGDGMDWIGALVIFGALFLILGAIDARKVADATAKTPLEPCFRCNPGDVRLQRKTKDDWYVRCFKCDAATEPTIFAHQAIMQWNHVNKALRASRVVAPEDDQV